MKKITIFILTLILTVFLSACNNSEIKFNSDLLKYNVREPEVSLPINKVTVSDVVGLHIVNEYKDYGFLIVSDDLSRLSAWSIFSNKLMFPFADELDVTVIESAFSYYIKKVTSENDTTIYDGFGRVVLQTGKYNNISIGGYYKNNYDDDGNLYGNDFIEVLNYTKEGETISTKKEFKIDKISKTRTEIVLDDYSLITNPKKIDLKEYGLDGYSMNKIRNTIFIYNKKDKVVNSIVLPEYNKYIIFDGKIFVQEVTMVNLNSEDYSYIQALNKYKLNTFTIDLLTSNRTDLDVNYIINDLSIFYDKDRVIKYASANVFMINGIEANSDFKSVIIDKDGKIVNSTGIIDFKNAIKLNNNRYFDPTTRYVYNEKLEPLFGFDAGKYMFDYVQEVITVIHDDYLGVIDYDGNILIPFEYRFLKPKFIKSMTIGLNKDGKTYIVDLDNNKKEVDKYDNEITTGLLYSDELNQTKGKYEFRMYDYDDITVLSFDYERRVGASFTFKNTIYGDFYISKYAMHDGSYKYIVIDVTDARLEKVV